MNVRDGHGGQNGSYTAGDATGKVGKMRRFIGTHPAEAWTLAAVPPPADVELEVFCPTATPRWQLTVARFDARHGWWCCYRQAPIEHTVTHYMPAAAQGTTADTERAKRPIGLVACCGEKLPTAAAARDLYRSQLYRLSRAYVERECDEWAILSARHGLVLPGQVIEPYNFTLNDCSLAGVKSWGLRVGQQIRKQWPWWTCRRFTVLAGRRYRYCLDQLNVTVPLEGLGIGQQLAALVKMTREAA